MCDCLKQWQEVISALSTLRGDVAALIAVVRSVLDDSDDDFIDDGSDDSDATSVARSR